MIGNSTDHQRYMRMAIDEAKKSVYIESAFCVGCVIVKNNLVISTGFSREMPGNTHAEQCALEKLTHESAHNASIYCTMEPCSIRLSGNLSCVSRIIEAGIAEVFLAVQEPVDFVECSGIEELERSGIVVSIVAGFDEQALRIARGQEI